MVSLLPGSSSDANDMHWQPSSAHSPASTVSTAMSPILWQAPIATVMPASAPVPNPFQHGLHRLSSLQLDLGIKASVLFWVSYISCIVSCRIVASRMSILGVPKLLPCICFAVSIPTACYCAKGAMRLRAKHSICIHPHGQPQANSGCVASRLSLWVMTRTWLRLRRVPRQALTMSA